MYRLLDAGRHRDTMEVNCRAMAKLLAHSGSIVGFANRVGAGRVVSRWLPKDSASFAELPRRYSASEEVVLGKTGIRTSLLAMGTGIRAKDQHSNQTALGSAGLTALLLNGYEQGLRFFDTADSYGSHAHVAGLSSKFRVPA